MSFSFGEAAADCEDKTRQVLACSKAILNKLREQQQAQNVTVT